MKNQSIRILYYLLLYSSILIFAVLILNQISIAYSASPHFSISVNDILVSRLDHPVQITNAADGTNRLFVLEQPGRIKIIQNQSVLPEPMLDISHLISYGGEQGLLGVAFHPDFQSNKYFYLNYTRKGDGATIIARYQVSEDPNIANPNSANILLTIPQPYSNHNGGQLLFGPDGYLYIGMGDGGSGGDPLQLAQDIDSLLGKMLRIDVDGDSPYAIPPDNPYVNLPGSDEIWALGLRNPWRFSFDRVAGDLFIGDVGQGAWEEIDYVQVAIPGGTNFGWRCMEGNHTYTSTPPCNDANLLSTFTNPITEYSHSEGYSITGGFVYRGALYPNLYGTYFFADYVTGKIYSIKQLTDNPTTWSVHVLELDTGFNISAFGEGEDGELYVCDYSGGTIRKLIDPDGLIDLTGSKKYANTNWSDTGETITYTIQLNNQGASLTIPSYLTDTIPSGLQYIPSSLNASHGSVDDSQAPTLNWSGTITQGITITIQYQATVSATSGTQINQAILGTGSTRLLTLSSSVFIPRPVLTTTGNDFILPGTQPGDLNTPLLDSLDCDTCHNAAIYDNWRGSMMSHATRDPLMWAGLSVANNYVPNAGEICLRCHTPMGWLAGHSDPVDGSLLREDDLNNGISCQTCHRMVDPVSTNYPIDEAEYIDNQIRINLSLKPPTSTIGSAMLIVDPEDRRRGPFSLGSTFNYHSAFQTEFLGQIYSSKNQTRVCATCHNVYNPILTWDLQRDQFWPNSHDEQAPSLEPGQLFPVETTYEEWFLSDYANGGVYAPQFSGYNPDKTIETCQDCHMTRSTGIATDENFYPLQRDCLITGCLPEHGFLGANTWIPDILSKTNWRLNSPSLAGYLHDSKEMTERFLTKAATLHINIVEENSNKYAEVRVTNETGHKLPTGYPEGRRMWIHLVAFDETGDIVAEYGFYDPVNGTLTNNTTIFEVKQALTDELANLLGLSSGPSFHFMLNNTVNKDNRIPPRGYTQDNFDKVGLKPVGEIYEDGQYWHDSTYPIPFNTAVVHATLYYQVASKDYIDFLSTFGGIDGMTVLNLWNQIPNQPQVVQSAWYPNYNSYFPLLNR